jgi:hypothetical protein
MALYGETEMLELHAARAACGAQSPGGLSEGTLTSSARKRTASSRLPARKSWMTALGSAAAISAPAESSR